MKGIKYGLPPEEVIWKVTNVANCVSFSHSKDISEGLIKLWVFLTPGMNSSPEVITIQAI